MSLRATSWVLGHSETENALRLVLVCMAHNANADGEGRMTPAGVTKQAKIPREHVGNALELLARQGNITYGDWSKRRNGRSGQTFGYRILIPDDYHPRGLG